MGRIEEVHLGPDKRVRVADIRTASGIITRPIVKLCILPICEKSVDRLEVVFCDVLSKLSTFVYANLFLLFRFLYSLLQMEQMQSELCLVCFRYHPLRFCKQFRRMTLQQRTYIVRVHRYCSNCFARTHLIGGCTSMEVCQLCGDLHHTMLHPQQPQSLRPRRQQQQPSQLQEQQQRQRRQSQQLPQRQRRQLQQQPQRQRRNQQQPQRQRRLQQQPQRQRRLQQQPQSQRRPQQLQRQQQPQRQRRPQQQPQRQRRPQQQPQPQRRQQQPLIDLSDQADATPDAQGLVQQIVSALDRLTGVLNIAPVQGGDNVEDRLSQDLIDLD